MTDGDPTYCGATTKAGTPCKQRAGTRTGHPGTGRCWKHGGAAPQVEAKAAGVELEKVAANMATMLKIDPMDGLVQVCYVQAGRVAFLRSLEADLEPDDLFDADGREHPLIKTTRLEINQWARLNKMAVDAGVAERIVRMAERTAAMIGAAAEEAFQQEIEGAPPEVVEWFRSQKTRGRIASGVERRLMVLEASDDDAG